MQFHIPSVVQAVPAAIAVPVPVVPVPVLTGAADETTEGVADDATTGLAGDATEVEVACGAADDEIEAKTPPDTAGAAVAWELDEAVAAAAATDAPHDGPDGRASENDPNRSTESPGLGNWVSKVSLLVQDEAGMFATNISGRALNAASRSAI